MSTIYTIDFTDPTKGSFLIPKAGFNGPGGATANTTLRLYGRGALDWGEAVDENLVRLTENFSSATAPINPLDGQIWRSVSLYWHNSSSGTYAGWYRFDWDINSATYNTWVLIGDAGTVASTNASAVIGNYYYDNGTSTLYRYDSLYKQQAASWSPRSFTARAGAPVNGTDYPETVFKVYNSAKAAWKNLVPGKSGPTAPTAAESEKGSLWFDTSTSVLKVYNGTSWTPLLSSAGSTIDAGNNYVINVNTGAYPQADSNNAANVTYVNDAVDSLTGGSATRFPLLAAFDGAGTGLLTKTGSSTVAARTLVASALVGTGSAGNGLLVTNGNGVAGNPTIALDTSVIATVSYVTAAVANAGNNITVEPISAGVPSNAVGADGDIRYQY